MILKIVFFLFTLPLSTLCFDLDQSYDNECIYVPLIKNFDTEKAMGTWFIQEVGDQDEGNKKCLLYSYTIQKNKRSPWRRIIGEEMCHRQITDSRTYNIKLDQIGNTSEYRINWNGKIRSGWTVGTDYYSWCVAYLCFPEEPNKGILYIGTRKMVPSKETMKSAHTLIKQLGFNLAKSYLKKVDHTNCNYTQN